ncbi:unnamed protein product, partial [Acidocella sp. C78]
VVHTKESTSVCTRLLSLCSYIHDKIIQRINDLLTFKKCYISQGVKMKILYYSVHHILEDDEVRMFKSLGHSVCVLGVNNDRGAVQNFRPHIEFNLEELDFYKKFREMGCEFNFFTRYAKLKKSFIDLFDVVIVMDDVDFIINNWELFSNIQVIWRTIGQKLDYSEIKIRKYRENGLKIIRYSEIEKKVPYYCGEDAIIRFGKDPLLYSNWNGKNGFILSFSNNYKQRYPLDASDYISITDGFPNILGGIDNDGFPCSIGYLDPKDQIEFYRGAAVYLYASGLNIPYTLNFIEAWMMGVPLVVYAPPERCGPYFEIEKFIKHGSNGFICRTIGESRDVLYSLLNDQNLSNKISKSGRSDAINRFSINTISKQWDIFLNSLEKNQENYNNNFYNGIMNDNNFIKNNFSIINNYNEIFNTLSLLRPFDIDLKKVRFGNERDGGYVLADRELNENVISFGVGPDVSFEFDLAERGANVFLHDHTVNECPQTHERFNFKRIGICGENEKIPKCIPLIDHLDNIPNNKKSMLLKMDIEGGEWDIFSTISHEILSIFDQIVLEIHFLERILNPDFNMKVRKSLQLINEQFTLFHVHGNNCMPLYIVEGFTIASVLELSFIRTNLVKRSASSTVYPSPLDKANNPKMRDLPLLFFPFLPVSADAQLITEMIERLPR